MVDQLTKHQRKHSCILMRVVCQDWFSLADVDNETIGMLELTGNVWIERQPGMYPSRRMHLTEAGYTYLWWLIAKERQTRAIPGFPDRAQITRKKPSA